MTIKIVTDSTAYISKEDCQRLGIRVVPLSVTFSGVTEDEGLPGEFEAYFEKLKTSPDFPTTSQPSPDAFAKVFEELTADGSEVITLVISAKLSGTYNSALVAAEMTAPDSISVIDTETTASNLKLLVFKVKELVDQELSRQEIVNTIEADKKKTGISLTVDTLDYLKKGGRLSGAQALLGSLLNVKPVIALVDGKLEPVGKVRGKRKALELMISRIPENVEQIRICHIFAMEEAQEVKTRLEQQFSGVQVSIDELGPVIGSHLGPKAIGLCSKWS